MRICAGGYEQSAIPQAASIEEVQGIISDFRHAADNAIQAGFDGVEVHGANGYLVHQFLSGQSNARTDRYGGTTENKARLLFEILDAIGEVLPPEKIALRLSPSMNDMQGITIDLDLNATFDYLVPKLSAYNLAYLHFLNPMKPVNEVPWAHADVAAYFRPVYKGTLMINSGFDFDAGNKIIEDGLADLVSFGRPFIANPDLVRRFQDGIPWPSRIRNLLYPWTGGLYHLPARELNIPIEFLPRSWKAPPFQEHGVYFSSWLPIIVLLVAWSK